MSRQAGDNRKIIRAAGNDYSQKIRAFSIDYDYGASRKFQLKDTRICGYNLAMPCNGAGLIGGTMYMNKREIQKAFKNGDLEGVKNQCVRYGNILSVKDWEVMNVERYNGAWRLYKIEHHDIQWKIEMHNGEVTSIERNHGEHKLF